MRNAVILRCFCGGLRESVKGKKEKKVAQKGPCLRRDSDLVINQS
jgi:hypothetical protein